MSTTDSRAEGLRARRQRLARVWGLERGAVLVAAGLPVPISGADLEHPFHVHPEYRYLAGLDGPGAVLAFTPDEGWTLFAPQISREDQVWMNASEPLASQQARAGVDAARPLADLAAWRDRRRGAPLALLGNPDLCRGPEGYGLPPGPSLAADIDADLSARVSRAVAAARRVKDAGEVALMREAARASIAGHARAQRLARPGMTERALQVEMEAEFFRQGALATAYPSIIGGGPHSAVLHGTPTDRPFAAGDLILIDAGAEIGGYASDITRTFPAGPAFSSLQRDLYTLVLHMQDDAIANARPGQEYRDLHLAACRTLAAGLIDLGVLRGNPDTLVESDAHALFFPHGLGHLLGLATHDAGGYAEGRTPSDRFGLNHLRTDLPLQPGYVVTMEPGFYMIPALLTDPDRRARYRDAVRWDRVDALLDFGGIRIEDNVLITADGADVLTAGLARRVTEIEAVRAEALSR